MQMDHDVSLYHTHFTGNICPRTCEYYPAFWLCHWSGSWSANFCAYSVLINFIKSHRFKYFAQIICCFLWTVDRVYKIMAAANLAKFGKILPKNSCLFLCDMQERFRPSIKYFDQIVQNSSRLLRAASILKLPVVVTEQYPKGNL